MSELNLSVMAPRIWQVGALCRAISDALDARFNPVAVRGEISGFSRAASGHCYFSLKDETGQIRCAMFRRSAGMLDFAPRDGELVDLRGRLDVYGPRGDLQLIVESMSRAGQGALFEQFLKLKAKLEGQGLFDAQRKRDLPLMPRAIGLVTSLGAAALHDVITALRRRVPHIPVVVAPALVQGSGAPREISQALSKLYQLTQAEPGPGPDLTPVVDVILLVRGGGSIEDLWAFNDENLAMTIAQSPVPVVSGVGHETDFTIADFVADLRAPTPTAAAELVAQPREVWLGVVATVESRLRDAVLRKIDTQSQRLDASASRLGRPSALANRQRLLLGTTEQRLRFALLQYLQQSNQVLRGHGTQIPRNFGRGLALKKERLDRAELRLGLLDPSLVLQRGYAWLADAQGHSITNVTQVHTGQALRATLADGTVDLTVS